MVNSESLLFHSDVCHNGGRIREIKVLGRRPIECELHSVGLLPFVFFDLLSSAEMMFFS